MKVTNRSDSTVAYSLPELNTRRVFNLGETKDVDEREMEMLFQQEGGNVLIRDYLLIHDEEWVMKHWEAPIEYFWQIDEIRKCVLDDSLELFKETLEYAPAGVIDLIKMLAWKTPITDLNKIEALRLATGFDTMAAIEVMAAETPQKPAPKKERLRKRTITQEV